MGATGLLGDPFTQRTLGFTSLSFLSHLTAFLSHSGGHRSILILPSVQWNEGLCFTNHGHPRIMGCRGMVITKNSATSRWPSNSKSAPAVYSTIPPWFDIPSTLCTQNGCAISLKTKPLSTANWKSMMLESAPVSSRAGTSGSGSLVAVGYTFKRILKSWVPIVRADGIFFSHDCSATWGFIGELSSPSFTSGPEPPLEGPPANGCLVVHEGLGETRGTWVSSFFGPALASQ